MCVASGMCFRLLGLVHVQGSVRVYKANLLITVAICAQLPLGAALNHCSHPPFALLLACGEFISRCRLRGGTCRWRYQLRLCLYVCYQAFSTLCNIALPLLSACLQFFICAYLPHWSYIQLVGSCPYACNHFVLTCLCLLLLGNYLLPIALALSV